ncbi:hypothetical protein C8035_v004284 [Colletotrichum spinosum]|uniref:Uncharacterized protein n=1 Tax=Colletotrichum spinosum TaxID=1347390 RepID=A0A4R8PRI8_9PEZI|nr:hypothetical protein C8035_v004284 [Colletotrichum spinosum]
MATRSNSEVTSDSPLLNLPLEIRLQIYGWVHAMHPIQHAQLAPWYPTPTYSSYFLQQIHKPDKRAENTAHGEGNPREFERATTDGLLSPHRPVCGLPTALLLTSNKVYNECRDLPFHTNEFVFVNWFSSGLWAARAFTRGLRAWQRAELRYARLEMLGRDFVGPALEEWKELCGEHWATGLRGLRLKILIGGGIFEPTASFASLKDGAERRALDITKMKGPQPEWIARGLCRLEKLEEIEVELSVLDWDDGDRLEWCEALEQMLNEKRQGERVIAVHWCPPSRAGQPNTVTHYSTQSEVPGHIMRGQFLPRCSEGASVDYSTAWPLEVRIPLLIAISICLMKLHPTVATLWKDIIWAVVRPFALLIGYVFVAVVRILILAFVDGPSLIWRLVFGDSEMELDVLGTLDTANNTKLNAIMGRLTATEAAAWVPGSVFDKKYKPFLATDKMKFAGPRQKKAMTRKRTFSC